MKTRQLIIILSSLTFFVGKAQVKDISFTLSPTVDYTWWDDKAGLEDNILVGGKLGFGFGEFVELRAIYLQSLDLKTSFKDFGIVGYNETLFNAQDITLTRWGGEFKANFGTKGIKPYLTLGAGVQNIDIDNLRDFEQVYGSLGLGAKFKITDRIVFAVEAKNTTYKFNSGMNLLSEEDKTDFGVSNDDFENERLLNWSVQGSLQFYLGGRKPGSFSELDKAYLQKFKGGFKGLQLVIEPSLAYTSFDSSSLFRDTYWLGGYAGLDLNEYIGIRAFYFQATQNEEISTDFDKMAMYGGEFRARLNDGNGVTPFLILGGGYLRPSDNYVPLANEDGSFSTVESGEFATGGLGLNIPLGKHILISGGARAMITSGENATDITNTDDIQTHIFYNVGLKFTLGKKSKAPTAVYQENLDRELSAQQQVSNAKIAQLKQDYQSKIEGLENDLKQAYEAKDVEKAVEILEEKKQVEEALKDVKAVEKVQKQEVVQQKGVNVKEDSLPTRIEKEIVKEIVKKEEVTSEKSKLIQMSPEQFESLIQRILNNLDEAPSSYKKDVTAPLDTKRSIQDQKIEQLNNRVQLLEKLLLQLNAKQATENKISTADIDEMYKNQQVNAMNNAILDKLDELNRKIDSNTNQIELDRVRSQTVIVKANETKEGEAISSKTEDNKEVENTSILDGTELPEEMTVNDTIAKEPTLKYKNSSAILGFNYGGASTGSIGFRLHYEIAKTKLEFMPEAYIGFGEANSWVLSGNVVYPIAIGSEDFEPYAGAGLGFGDFVDGLTGFYNIVLGTKLPILHKNLYVDYTMRNTFDYNQIAVGYNLKF